MLSIYLLDFIVYFHLKNKITTNKITNKIFILLLTDAVDILYSIQTTIYHIICFFRVFYIYMIN